jgi:hypothetical protein
VPVTSNSGNVHDTSVIPRPDGGFDAYFISATGLEGFSLYRRHLREDGSMGPDQRLTDAAVTGEASKPNVVRLPDGRVQLMYAGITQRHPQTGEPQRQQLFSAILGTDAPD